MVKNSGSKREKGIIVQVNSVIIIGEFIVFSINK
jgi:hypothetical protein